MAQFQLKIGLGTSSRIGTVKVYHVLKDGHTVGSFATRDEAVRWVRDNYGFDAMYQILRHERTP